MSKSVYENDHFFITDPGDGVINVIPKDSSHIIALRWSDRHGTYITTPGDMQVVPYGHNPAILIPQVEMD